MEFTLDQIDGFAETVLGRLKNTHTDKRASLLFLSGDLGAGKTTFVQALARTLGVTDRVTSPTFLIQKEYETTDETFQRFVHIDAYRLNSLDELQTLGWDDLIADPNTLIALEWPERVNLPNNADNTTTLTLEHISETARRAQLA